MEQIWKHETSEQYEIERIKKAGARGFWYVGRQYINGECTNQTKRQRSHAAASRALAKMVRAER